jgi:hypothetical protein
MKMQGTPFSVRGLKEAEDAPEVAITSASSLRPSSWPICFASNCERCGEGLGYFREEGMEKVGDDEAEQVTAAGHQPAGHEVGMVVELLDSLQDPGPRLLGDIRIIPKHFGDCHCREAQATRNVLHRHRHNVHYSTQALCHDGNYRSPARKRGGSADLAACHGCDDEKRLLARGNLFRESRVGRLVGQILGTGKEPHEGPAPMRDMIPDGPAEHGVSLFERVEDGLLRDPLSDLENYFAIDLCQHPEMSWKQDADLSPGHGNV